MLAAEATHQFGCVCELRRGQEEEEEEEEDASK